MKSTMGRMTIERKPVSRPGRHGGGNAREDRLLGVKRAQGIVELAYVGVGLLLQLAVKPGQNGLGALAVLGEQPPLLAHETPVDDGQRQDKRAEGQHDLRHQEDYRRNHGGAGGHDEEGQRGQRDPDDAGPGRQRRKGVDRLEPEQVELLDRADGTVDQPELAERVVVDGAADGEGDPAVRNDDGSGDRAETRLGVGRVVGHISENRIDDRPEQGSQEHRAGRHRAELVPELRQLRRLEVEQRAERGHRSHSHAVEVSHEGQRAPEPDGKKEEHRDEAERGRPFHPGENVDEQAMHGEEQQVGQPVGQGQPLDGAHQAICIARRVRCARARLRLLGPGIDRVGDRLCAHSIVAPSRYHGPTARCWGRREPG